MPPLKMKAAASGTTTAEICNRTPSRIAKCLTAMLKAWVTAVDVVRVRTNALSETTNAVMVKRPMHSRYALVARVLVRSSHRRSLGSFVWGLDLCN